MTKDYYVVLGVKPDSSAEELKSAYRQRVQELHPDHFGPNAEPFLRIQEAYGVLGDVARREAYDLYQRRQRNRASRAEPLRRSDRRPAEPLRAGEEGIDLGEASLSQSFETYGPSFDDIFSRIWRNFGREEAPKSEHPECLTVDIPITPAQALWGGQVRIFVPGLVECGICAGRGTVGDFECWQCGGQGAYVADQPVEVSYPPQVSHSHLVQVPLNRLGINNLYLTIRFVVGRPSTD